MVSYDAWSALLYDLGGRIVLAVLVLIIGRWVAKIIRKITRDVLTRKSVDPDNSVICREPCVRRTDGVCNPRGTGQV